MTIDRPISVIAGVQGALPTHRYTQQQITEASSWTSRHSPVSATSYADCMRTPRWRPATWCFRSKAIRR